MIHIGVKAFTINEHLLLHLPMIIKALGPARYFSARPLERMIGKFKQQINSKSHPSENAANIVLSHYSDVYNRAMHCYDQQINKTFKQLSVSELATQICQGSDEQDVMQILSDENDQFHAVHSCFLSVTGQQLMLNRRKDTRVLYKSTEGTKIAKVTALFASNTKDICYAGVVDSCLLPTDADVSSGTTISALSSEGLSAIIRTKDIIGYAILIPSIKKNNSFHVSCKPH